MSQKPPENWALFVRLLRELLLPHLGRVVLSLILAVASAASGGALAWLLKPAIDDIFVAKDTRMLFLIPLAVILVSVIKATADYVRGVLTERVGQRIIADVQVRLFGHLMEADIGWRHSNHSGRLLSRFLYDVGLLKDSVTRSGTNLISDGLTALFLVGVMFSMDWRLALVVTVILPTVGLLIREIGRRVRRFSTQVQEETSNLTALLTERLEGTRLIKAYGMEAHETGRISEAIERRLGYAMKGVATRVATVPLTDALGSIGIALAIFYGGYMVIAGTLTSGAFFAFIAAVIMAFQPVRSIANQNVVLQDGLAAGQRVFAMLDEKPLIADLPGAAPLDVRAGALRFEHVRFRYADGTLALDGLDLDVPAGKMIALVGASGGGKSTIINLIPRFYDPTEGRILIDDQDISTVSLGSLRGAMAFVAQEATLFDDSIRANIAYGRIGASEQEIVEAAKAAAAHDFIQALPRGYDTMVGEAGVKLSGGQRQRICIARAIVRDARILLLDEATSALDNESERQVQAALSRLMRGRTSVVVAHRLSTIIDADRIYVIERGRVTEAGRHGELLARGGAYARLYAQQQGEDGDAAQAG